MALAPRKTGGFYTQTMKALYRVLYRFAMKALLQAGKGKKRT